MQTMNTILPPQLLFSGSMLYANDGNIYELEVASGTVCQIYSIPGVACAIMANDVLYLNMSCDPDYQVQALHVNNGSLLWSYKVEGHLANAPVMANNVVYISTTEGIIYAFQADNGSLLWHSTILLGLDVPSFLGPIAFAPPTIADRIVYLAPTVNSPLKPFIYAFREKDGVLMWKTQLTESTPFSLTVINGIIYINDDSKCSALRATDGSSIWSYTTKARACSPPIVVNEIIYTSLSETKYDALSSMPDVIRQQAFLCARQASNGSLLWQQPFGNDVSNPTTPFVTQNAIYIGANDGFLYAFQKSDGAPLWRYQTSGTFLSSPTGTNEEIYISTNNGYVYALRATDGVLQWQTFVNTAITSTAGISLNTSSEEI